MDELLEGIESGSAANGAVAGAVVPVVVPTLAVEAIAVVIVLAVALVVLTLVPMLWFFARTGTLDGVFGSESPSEDEAALDRLRRRYADGELTEAEFERRVDRLLETESLDDAKTRRTDPERRTAEERRTVEERDAEPER